MDGWYGCRWAKRDQVWIGQLRGMMQKDLEFDWLQLTPKKAVAPERLSFCSILIFIDVPE
jgi:hypothetical protein